MSLDSVQTPQLLNDQPKHQVVASAVKNVERSTEPSNCGRVSLRWNQLSYKVTNKDLWKNVFSGKLSQVFKRKEDVILYPQSGDIETGSLTAVLGKSGSGKTTLIESVTGRRTTGLTGDIRISSRFDENDNKCGTKSVRISFIPQHDNLLSTLTVEESLMYASKLKNVSINDKATHQKIVNELIQQLDLEVCRRVYTRTCSGGQRKRLSIAMELVSRPTILILDEPTSGLDSASATQCVQLLKKLTESPKNPLAVLATIHQPNTDILFMFHKVYLMSHNGRCMFFGPPPELLHKFTDHNIPCPDFHNPADHAIDIACGDYGEEVILAMEETQMEWYNNNVTNRNRVENEERSLKSVVSSGPRKSLWTSLKQTQILFIRTILMTVRDPVLNFLRLFQYLMVALIVALLYNGKIGQESGCLFSTLTFDEVVEKQNMTTQNASFIFFILLYVCFVSLMSTLMVFPLEMQVFLKERNNGWYSTMAYYFAKTFADLPFQLSYTLLFVVITYDTTGQISCLWRFLLILVITVLVVAIGQSYGLLVGAVLSDNAEAAIFVGPALVMTSVLVCGFFSKVSTMPLYLKPLASLSFMRYAFEGAIITTYGFGRCETESAQVNWNRTLSQTETCIGLLKFLNNLNTYNISYESIQPLIEAYADAANASSEYVDQLENQIVKVSKLYTDVDTVQRNLIAENTSGVLKEYDLEDGLLQTDLLMLIVIFMVLRIFIYFVILFKSKPRK